MRVRHLVVTRSFAGVERHVSVLANEQARMGHDVEVWGGQPSTMRAHLHEGVRHRPAAGLLVAATKGLVSEAPDIVHAHMTKAEAAAVAVGSVRQAPLVVTRHFAAPRGSSLAGRVVRRSISRRVYAQIAISRFVADAVDGPSTVVYPGVETAVASKLGHRRPVVLVVQRLEAEKRTEVALRAFSAGVPPGWTLEIVGQGAEMSTLQALARDLGISDRTSFLGFRDDVPRLLEAGSVLVAPCEIEGLGLSVLEAMAHGLPVVASRAGAHPETVGRAREAHLFASGDVDEAAEMLARLCADETLRRRYGEELKDVQRDHFTPRAQALETEAVYRSVMQ